MANPNLEDSNQTVFCIPFADEGEEDFDVPLPQPAYNDRDLPEGEKIRIEAYTEAWGKCLNRVKSLIHALHAPIAADIVHQVHASYDNVLPGVPYPELPVISITNPTSGSAFLDQVTAHTDSFDLENGDLFEATAFTAHLYPSDCVNLTSAMKAMISGFVDRSHVLEKVKGRPATSLVNYDIETLWVWYMAARDAYDLTEEHQPKLIVLLHDFEQLDPTVIQDVFHISSLYVPRLPLVFILALSSPSSPSYLHTTYPRSTLALLRVRNYTVPSGTEVLEEIILKTFFDVEFEPDIMIGPSVLVFLTDHYSRQDSSLDATLKVLHLAHLKHFSVEPLTLLVKSTPSLDILGQPLSFPFIDALFARLQASEGSPSADASEWSQKSLQSLATSINDARTLFYARARRLRIGLGIMRHVQEFMAKQGYKGLDWGQHPGGVGILDVINDLLCGKLGSDIKFLGNMVRKLRGAQLGALLETLHVYFNDMPSTIRSSEEEARTKVIFTINSLPQPTNDDDVSGIASQVAGGFGEWLIEYLNSLLAPLEDGNLWDIWYTGLSVFPADLINPSARASVIAGLLQPHDFAERGDEEDDKRTNFPLWELPDTSILFRRYLDSGKLINLYDWFESFQVEVETQRKNLKKRAAVTKSRPNSPTKRGRKDKAKAAEKEVEVEEHTDKWKLEVQARFMRALQELDYLGFIKHTGRKADHVQRVAFDMHD
ncbi:origin recognition complex subunit 3 N-terminus-domain-containing protein [Lyophyllum atratum]|nr:origin recognition complex subunit 3 N-terminus-domain-containing protein [Lyophyllum atratum]